MADSLRTISQTPNPGAVVTLFRLDATLVGGGINYFCQGKVGVDDVVFGGVTYTAFDIHMTDFDTNAGGVLPTPKIQISNSNSVTQALVNQYGDLCGCEIRRIRTFQRFLDGQPEADPTAFMGPDIFLIDRKSDENPIYIEWELSAAIDQQGKLLPGRQVIRDTCWWRYRTYDPTNPDAAEDGFVYSTINACPYSGTAFFTSSDVSTTDPSQDQCSLQVTGCQARFGNASLPFGGFPGAGRVQTA